MQNGNEIECVVTPPNDVVQCPRLEESVPEPEPVLEPAPSPAPLTAPANTLLADPMFRRARSCSPCPTHMMDSSLQDKVARFNTAAAQHQQAQKLNPFSEAGGKNNLLKPKFAREDYGKPAPGSLTEARGVKAFSHVCKEMLELCDVINQYGEIVDDDIRVIAFGYLFEIYTRINDKLVGLLLRARKHQFIDFEGECLFQRRDDDVPVYLKKNIKDIRMQCQEKVEAARRSITPTPQ